jgi:hypothetical protein
MHVVPELRLSIPLQLRVPALVYLALNFLDKYQHRVVVAVLVLVYAGMHAASALRSFHFFQRIERLEGEARRLAATSARDRTRRPRASRSSAMSPRSATPAR